MRRDVEPPSGEPPSNKQLFMIGRNSRGNWVVRDQSGLRGALFVDRIEALRFALFENGGRPHAVLMVPDILELDLDQTAGAAPQTQIALHPTLQRKAA